MYAEMVCIPTHSYDVFVDMAISLTHGAIEESTSDALDSFNLDAFNNVKFYHVSRKMQSMLQESISRHIFKTFIIRTIHDPASTPLYLYETHQQISSNKSQASSPLNATHSASSTTHWQNLTLLQALEAFADIISSRLGHEVGFAYMLHYKPNHNWIAHYQASITPLQCGRYYIRPSWHKANETYENIIIDPALAFGSGHHASTFMCIDMLSRLHLTQKICLDVGCGSGILGIIMAKQGGVVDVCDVDGLAIEEARKNFARNGVFARRMILGSVNDVAHHGALASSPILYDVICANIVADVLIEMRDDLLAVLKPCGILILSGIIIEKHKALKVAFGDMALLEQKQQDEWVSFAFMVKA